MLYKITAPNLSYNRKIGGVQFVNGVAQTENDWLASWFSGRAGFAVTTEQTETLRRGRKPHDSGNIDAAGEGVAAES